MPRVSGDETKKSAGSIPHARRLEAAYAYRTRVSVPVHAAPMISLVIRLARPTLHIPENLKRAAVGLTAGAVTVTGAFIAPSIPEPRTDLGTYRHVLSLPCRVDQQNPIRVDLSTGKVILRKTIADQRVDRDERANLCAIEQQLGAAIEKRTGLPSPSAGETAWLIEARAVVAGAHVLLREQRWSETAADPEAASRELRGIEQQIAAAKAGGQDYNRELNAMIALSAALHEAAPALAADRDQIAAEALDLDALLDELQGISRAQEASAAPRAERIAALDAEVSAKLASEVDALIAGARAYTADHPAGGDAALKAVVLELIAAKVPTAEISAKIDATYLASDDFLLRHPEEIVTRVYAELGIAPSAENAAVHQAAAKQRAAEGKSVAEIRDAATNAIVDSPENWSRFRNSDRDAVYMSQLYPVRNTSWCGPFSGAMSLVSLGVAERGDMDVVRRIAELDGQSWNDGVPGNVSIIARSLRELGVEAETHEYRGVAEIRSALEDGKVVIANGGMPCCDGHFLTLLGLDEEGRYIVADPFRDQITRWNDSELRGFIEFPSGHPTQWASVWRTR